MTTLSVNEYGLLPREKYMRLYHLLTRSRFLNDKLEWLKESARKIHGPVLLSQGQEHITVGAMFALEDIGIADQSWVGISHRDQPLFTCKGPSLELELIKNHLQKKTSWGRGHDGNTHIGSRAHKIIPFAASHMGAPVAISVGVAEALRDMEYPEINDPQRRPVVLAFFGDGAAQQGCIHEAFNLTAASNAEIEEYEREIFRPFFDAINEETERMYGAPIVFILNNNEYAITTRARDQHGHSHLVRRADGYANMAGIEVSENDPIAVYHAVRKGIRRAQRLQGSTLIVCNSYRLCGHNTSEERTYMAQDELIVARANDPIYVFTSFLTNLRIRSENPPYEEKQLITPEELTELDKRNRQEIDELVAKALNEPDAVPPRDEDLSEFMFMPHVYASVNASSGDVPTRRMRCREAIIHALRHTLLNNPKFRLLGEDVRDPRGGVLALTKGLSTEFGPRRVRNTPLSEFAIVGSAAGQAMYGLPVLAEMQFAPFVTSAMTLIAYSIPTSYSQNQINLPLVLMMPYGVVGPGGSGNEHSHSMESWFYHTHGWKIIFPSDAFDACGLLLAAIEDPNPVMFFVHIRANNDSEFASEVPLEPHVIPIGKANIKRSGSDLTVVSYGAAAVRAALNTAIVLDREKSISLEIIDLRSIVPLDMETVKNSVKKTGRVIIIHEASKTGGVGESIASKISESEAFSYIRTLPPITILGAKDYPVPNAYALEWDRLPFEEVPGNRIDPKADADLTRLFSQKLYDAACSLKAF